MKRQSTETSASKVINLLGGTGKVADIFEIADATVSIWRKKGIPKARRMYLELKYPDVFVQLSESAPDISTK